MKKSRRKAVENQGSNLTFLNNSQCKELFKKYDKHIIRECRKLSFIPGLDAKDLAQECRIKIVRGYHKYDKKRNTKEKTWIIAIIRKTLYGIWNHTMKEKRTNFVSNDDGKIPVYNYSFGSYNSNNEDEIFTLEETYGDPPDSRPAFATHNPSPEESIFVMDILEILKLTLPKESYQYVKDHISPPQYQKELSCLEKTFRKQLSEEGFSRIKDKEEFEIWHQVSNVSENELSILSQIAQVLIDRCGFCREEILKHENMIDANI